MPFLNELARLRTNEVVRVLTSHRILLYSVLSIISVWVVTTNALKNYSNFSEQACISYTNGYHFLRGHVLPLKRQIKTRPYLLAILRHALTFYGSLDPPPIARDRFSLAYPHTKKVMETTRNRMPVVSERTGSLVDDCRHPS